MGQLRAGRGRQQQTGFHYARHSLTQPRDIRTNPIPQSRLNLTYCIGDTEVGKDFFHRLGLSNGCLGSGHGTMDSLFSPTL